MSAPLPLIMPPLVKPNLVLQNQTLIWPQTERRVKEEMKAAARVYYEQEAKTKADKKEKMSKVLESTADAAARTIQKMYYTFTVRHLQGNSLLCRRTVFS